MSFFDNILDTTQKIANKGAGAINSVLGNIPGISDSSDKYTVGIDFFNYFNLHKYSTDTGYDTDPKDVASFIPLYLSSTVVSTGTDGNKTMIGSEDKSQIDDDESNLIFILPWANHEIRDSASVNFSKKYSGGVQGNLAQAAGVKISEFTKGFGGFSADAVKALTDLFLIDYDSGSLKKELTFNFILPLMSTNTSGVMNGSRSTSYVTEEWAQDVRNALGSLQGLVYPKTIAALVPPLMKVRLGSLYRGFKGFVSKVEFTESDTYITSGSVLWPTVITGSITLVNVFNYFWSGTTNSNYSDAGMGEFNLQKNPSLLFGIYDASGGTGINGNAKAEALSSKGNSGNITIGSSNVTVRKNYGSLKEKLYLNHYKNNKLANGLVDQKYITTSDEIDAVTMKNATKSATEFTETMENTSKSSYETHEITNYLKDNNVGDTEIIAYNNMAYNSANNVLSFISNENLDFIGMGTDGNGNYLSSSCILSNEVAKRFNADTIQVSSGTTKVAIDNPYKLINTGSYAKSISKLLNTSGGLNNLSLASKICDSTLNDFNTNATALGNNFNLVSDIIKSKSNDINIDNALLQYTDSSNFITNIKKISNYSEFTNSLYAAALYSKQYYLMANSINAGITNNNSVYSDGSSAPYFPMSTLYNSSLILNGTEFYSYLSFYNDLWLALNDKVVELNDNGYINTVIQSIVDRIYANTQLLKNDSMSSTNAKLYDVVSNIINTLV